MTGERLRRARLAVPIALLGAWGCALAISGRAPWLDLPFGAAATVAAGALAAAAGLRLLRALLARGGRSAAVGGMLIDELVRRRVLPLAIALVLGGLALLPFALATNPLLHHRLESLISHSLALTMLVLTILTVFGACGSLCEEILARRIHTVAAKPVGRVRLLAGRWLALILVDALLLAIAGSITFGTLHLELARARAAGTDTAAAERLLAVHRSLPPLFPDELGSAVRARVAELPTADPDGWARLVESHDGDAEAATEAATLELARGAVRAWRSVPPGESRQYRFAAPAALGGTIRLRPELLRLHATERVRLAIAIEGEERSVFIGGGGDSAAIEVPAAALADGFLDLAIANPAGDELARTAILTGRDMLLLEVPAGGLAANLARGLAILAIDLGFVAALGLAASTFLGLPVAVLLVLVVLLAAAGGGVFIGEPSPLATAGHDHDHGAHAAPPSGFIEATDRYGRAFLSLLSAWGRFPAIEPVSRAEEVSWATVGGCLLWIGAVWTGIVAIGGGTILSRRELARVQV